VCQTVRWVLAITPWKGAGSAPYTFLCTFISDQTTAWKEMPVAWRAGRYQAWWVGNIVLSGSPKLGRDIAPDQSTASNGDAEKQEWKISAEYGR